MGYWSLVMAGGPVLGAVAGGPIVEAFGWRWIFVGQVPFVIAGLLVAYAVLPEGERSERVPFDFVGSVLLGGSAALFVLALNRGPVMGWDNPIVWGAFLVVPVGLYLFVRRQATFAHPLIPLDYFRRRNFTFPILTQMSSPSLARSQGEWHHDLRIRSWEPACPIRCSTRAASNTRCRCCAPARRSRPWHPAPCSMSWPPTPAA
jgi:MFS family permease